MIGDGNSLLTICNSFIHEGGDMGSSVKQGVMCMAMEMNKFRHTGGLKMPKSPYAHLLRAFSTKVSK
jgi:hypothetical protein